MPAMTQYPAPLAGRPQYASVAALRATTSSASAVQVLGYYAAGDGGGGTFRWDATDTTSTDNGGTIIVPTSELSAAGRWKRIYDGEINGRWFGMRPGGTDNTAQLQAAVTWACTDVTRSPGGIVPGGGVFIPLGYYRFQFTAGTSGLSTITVDADNVLIKGEGRGTVLTVRSPSAKVERFFTFSRSIRGAGGGIRDIAIDGHSELNWVAYLNVWRNAAFENVTVTDVHGGFLDAAADLVGANLGENILVHHIDYLPTSGTNSCFSQFMVRFRATTAGTTWSECTIRDCEFGCVWDAAVVLDGVQRFTVDQIAGCTDTASTNTIDGASRSGIFNTVRITNTCLTGAWHGDTGFHTVSNIYQESHQGSENTTDNNAVLIESPVGQSGYNRYNIVENVVNSATGLEGPGLGPGLFKITNDSATAGRTVANVFRGNRRPIPWDRIHVGPNVQDTQLFLTPNPNASAILGGQLWKVQDQGTRTYINGVRSYAYGALYPAHSQVDVGMITRDTGTGRVVLQDRDNVSVLIGPRHGVDVVSTHGAQRITSMATPTAPVIYLTPITTGSTTWTYYVVAVDKDGNKTPPSPAGAVTTGPASLASTPNTIKWAPVDGAVTYDLLRGSTSTSIALGLTTCTFTDDGVSTSAYTPSATSPPGTLVVDGQLTAASTFLPNLASAPATPTAGGILYVQAGSLRFKGSSGTVTTLGPA